MAATIVTGDGFNVTLYEYIPSGVAGYTFVGLFGLSTAGHFVSMFPFRSWHFLSLIIGGICESGGYYGRAWSHREPINFNAYILQMMLILAAPVFIAATVYMTLARLIRALDAEDYSMIRTRWLSKLYILVDIIVFMTQIGGVGVQVTGDPEIMKIGQDAVMGGLIFQLFSFVFFLIIARRFHTRLQESSKDAFGQPRIRWQRQLWAIYGAGLLILLRNLVRIIEFAQGTSGFVASHEVFIYLFDATPMFLVILILLIFHPGKIIKEANRRQKELVSTDMTSAIDDSSRTFLNPAMRQEGWNPL